VVCEEASTGANESVSGDEAGVVLVFLVPGTILPPPGFTGIRTSNYFKEQHSKQLQAAVPADITTREQLRTFLTEVFTDAPIVAMEALKRQRVPASLECATEAARRVVARLDEVVDEAWRRHQH
jgi:hypothetical protein